MKEYEKIAVQLQDAYERIAKSRGLYAGDDRFDIKSDEGQVAAAACKEVFEELLAENKRLREQQEGER